VPDAGTLIDVAERALNQHERHVLRAGIWLGRMLELENGRSAMGRARARIRYQFRAAGIPLPEKWENEE